MDNPIIGQEELAKARETLRKYKTGKANLERRIVENEQWWKLRHWQQMRHGGANDPKPASGWLVNVCMSKHADAMDAYPECVCLPREPDDRRAAQLLSSILPVVLEQNEYETVYSDCWWYKIKHGASCKGIFWDQSLLGGLGDIAIRRVDLLHLFWEPGVTDIQRSRNVFHTELRDNDQLEAEYPQLRGKLAGQGMALTRYLYDDAVDTAHKSVVVDWYYKKREGWNSVLHFCKFVGDTLLYSSENEGRPWYAHGKYPFVFDVLFPEEGTPAGFGYIDLCKDAQEQIDLMNNAILKNTLAAATPRWFIRNDGAINEEEYLDWTAPFVHTNASLGQDAILPVTVSGLNDVYVACLNNKITELKEVSGNRDVANGGTVSGVTAASAIAAMQEQAGKLSRDQIQGAYRAFRAEMLLVIELMREFYDAPRCFRISGGFGADGFVSFYNRGLQPQPQGSDFGVDLGARTPLFDIQVHAQRQNAYSKAVYNELGLQLYQLGFFNPEMAPQALQCLEIMDFQGRYAVMGRIARQAAQYQAQKATAQPAAAAETSLPEADRLGRLREKEHPVVERARAAARDAARPRD